MGRANFSTANKKWAPRVSTLLISLALLACQSPLQLLQSSFKPGDYDGFYIRREGKTSLQGFFAGKIEKGDLSHPVQGHFTDNAKVNFDLDIVSTEKKDVFHVTVKGMSDDVLVVKADRLARCLISAEGADVTARICKGTSGVTMEFSNKEGVETTLGFDPREKDTTPVEPAPPANYTLEQVVDRALNQSFDSRVKYEASLRSRQNALEARLNLVPHFHLSSALSVVNIATGGSWTALIGIVGDAAPFIIPSNWFKASSAGAQADVDRYGYLIARADAGSNAEGLVYSLLRDEQSKAVLQSYEGPIRVLRDQMAQAEQVGAQAPGTAADLTAVLLEIDTMNVTYDAAIRAGKRAIGQAMGLVNPEAVIGVKAENLPSLEQTVNPDVRITEKLVLDLALELRQMDSMIIQARKDVQGKRYDWIDPSGTALGLGRGASILAAQANVREVEAQRRKLEASLIEKVHQAYDTITIAAKTIEIAGQKVKLRQTQITDYQNDITVGRPVTGLDLQTALSAAMRAEIDRVEANASYYVAVANLNRLLYIGAYAQTAGTPVPATRPVPSPAPTP